MEAIEGQKRKQADPSDNRVKLVSLTDKGRGLIPDFLDVSIKLQSKVYKNLTDDEKETLIDLLAKINSGW